MARRPDVVSARAELAIARGCLERSKRVVDFAIHDGKKRVPMEAFMEMHNAMLSFWHAIDKLAPEP